MTPRERVEAALHWQPVDFVPFTVYERKLPMCAAERRLRNDGLCIVDRVNTFSGGTTGLTTETYGYVEGGHRLERTVYHTPAGDLTCVREPLGYTTWTHEHLFKSEDDYEPLAWMLEHQSFQPYRKRFDEAQAAWEDDAFVRANATNLPIQTLISSYMGTITFGYEWMDHRDQVERLIAALQQTFIQSCECIAQGPGVAVNLGGNHSPSILGRELFAKYIAEPWEEACEILHGAGKLVGSHLDDNNRLWADIVADSALDYVEAFTPAPDTDLTLAEARELWPDKVLWINFPSSQHHKSHEEISAITRRLIAEAGDGRGLILGITEDVPPDRWADSFDAILTTSRAVGPRPARSDVP